MFKIKKDIVRNRLYVTLTGILSLDAAREAKKLIETEVAGLKPNFDLINDISKFIHGDDEAGIILKEIMIILIQNKVNRVIRIVGTSRMGLLQFANNSLAVESYKLSYVPTLEEAEKILNEE
ncbi:MAG: hypothetical protein WC061_03700 [Melioribacteraceae bacterium]